MPVLRGSAGRDGGAGSARQPRAVAAAAPAGAAGGAGGGSGSRARAGRRLHDRRAGDRARRTSSARCARWAAPSTSSESGKLVYTFDDLAREHAAVRTARALASPDEAAPGAVCCRPPTRVTGFATRSPRSPRFGRSSTGAGGRRSGYHSRPDGGSDRRSGPEAGGADRVGAAALQAGAVVAGRDAGAGGRGDDRIALGGGDRAAGAIAGANRRADGGPVSDGERDGV